MIPEMPRKSIIGSFTAGDPKDSRQALAHVGNKDELYVHIALTTLPPESDFYHMLKVSDHDQEHIARIMLNERNKTPMILQEGDAVIWRGDMHCLLSPRGGGEYLLWLSVHVQWRLTCFPGHWQSLTFNCAPCIIDLTD